MAVVNLQSSKVLVFPSSRRGQEQLSARYQQESTYTDIITQMCNHTNGSFIITFPEIVNNVATYDLNKPFELSLGGYRFKINKLSDILSNFTSSTKIYAYIYTDSLEIDPVTHETRVELCGRDATDGTTKQYLGLSFSDSEGQTVSDKDLHQLLIFERPNTSVPWEIYYNKYALTRLTQDELDIVVDGGII